MRFKRLLPVIEALSCEIQGLDFAVIDAQPIPVCTFKRAPRCKFKGARHGFSTSSMVYGFKLHAWTTLPFRVVHDDLRPANEHDFAVGCAMNHDWPACGGPKLIGDKGHPSGTYLSPPKKNAKQPDLRWKVEYAAARKIDESAFSTLMADGNGTALGPGQNSGDLATQGGAHRPRLQPGVPQPWPPTLTPPQQQPLFAVI